MNIAQPTDNGIEIINDIINTKDLDQKLKSNKVLINRVVKIRMKT